MKKVQLKNVSVKGVGIGYAGDDVNFGIKFTTFCSVEIARKLECFPSIYDDSEKPTRPRNFDSFQAAVEFPDATVDFTRHPSVPVTQMRGRVKEFVVHKIDGKLHLEFNMVVPATLETCEFLLQVKKNNIPEIEINGNQKDLDFGKQDDGEKGPKQNRLLKDEDD